MKIRKLLRWCTPCSGKGQIPSYTEAADVLKDGKFVYGARAQFTAYYMCGHCMGKGHR